MEEEVKIKKRGYIIKGFLMCLLSPTTLMFWIMVGGLVTVHLNYTMTEKIVFFIVALITQLTMDSIKTFYAAKLRYRIKESIDPETQPHCRGCDHYFCHTPVCRGDQ